MRICEYNNLGGLRLQGWALGQSKPLCIYSWHRATFSPKHKHIMVSETRSMRIRAARTLGDLRLQWLSIGQRSSAE